MDSFGASSGVCGALYERYKQKGSLLPFIKLTASLLSALVKYSSNSADLLFRTRGR